MIKYQNVSLRVGYQAAIRCSVYDRIKSRRINWTERGQGIRRPLDIGGEDWRGCNGAWSVVNAER